MIRNSQFLYWPLFVISIRSSAFGSELLSKHNHLSLRQVVEFGKNDNWRPVWLQQLSFKKTVKGRFRDFQLSIPLIKTGKPARTIIIFTLTNLSRVVYAWIHSVNLMCTDRKYQMFSRRHFSALFPPNIGRTGYLLSALPGGQHIRSRNTALVQLVVGMMWFLPLWIKNTISKVTRQSYERLICSPLVSHGCELMITIAGLRTDCHGSDASVWNIW